jgi:predicted phage terminase large subunit-like protein
MDPIKNRQEADSETFRERVWEEYLYSIKTRLSAKGKIILIMTRWHQDDLAGRIIANEGDKVHVINLPCEAEEGDPLGRNIGDSLAPEIGKDNEWLKIFKESYKTGEGSRAWNALFQGRPTAQEGNMIKRIWIKYWKHKDTNLPPITFKFENGEYYSIDAIDIPDEFTRALQSWDLAFKGDKKNDKVAGQVWSSIGAKIFLNDNINKNLTFTETLVEIEKMTNKHKNATLKLVEDKANGPAVIDMLQHKIGGIVPVNPEGSKQARLSAVSPLFEAGNIYLPHPLLYDWVNEFVEQLISFPNAKNDDMVDAASQALYRFMYSTDISVMTKKQDDDEDEDEIKTEGWFA